MSEWKVILYATDLVKLFWFFKCHQNEEMQSLNLKFFRDKTPIVQIHPIFKFSGLVKYNYNVKQTKIKKIRDGFIQLIQLNSCLQQLWD